MQAQADLTQAVIQLTENEDTMKQLRKTKRVHRDEGQGKEYVWGVFNGMHIPFYVGEPKVLPLAMAEGIERDNTCHLDIPCPQCKGKGSTPAGICFECRGRKWAKTDERYRVFKISRRYNPLLVDPTSIAAANAVINVAGAE